MLYHIAYTPWWCGDSAGYSDSYYLWVHRYFTVAARTPVYPLFLGLVQLLSGVPPAVRLATSAANMATLLQSLCGIIAVCLLYYTLRILLQSPWIAFLAALFFSVLVGACEFEMLILAESLSLFALVLGAWLYTRTMAAVADARNPVRLSVVTGAAFGCAALLRPENLVFFFILVLVTAAQYLRSRSIPSRRGQVRGLAVVVLLLPLSAAPLVLAWTTWNFFGIGQFRITTLTGWNLSATTYNMFDRVEPKDRVLGEIASRNFAKRNQGSIVRGHIWSAYDELVARHDEMPIKRSRPISRTSPDAMRRLIGRIDHAFGMRPADLLYSDLGDYIGSVSAQLIRRYPRDWLSNIADNFVRDTFQFNYEAPDSLESSDAQSPTGGIVVRYGRLRNLLSQWNGVQRPILKLCYIVLLSYVILGPWIAAKRLNPNFLRDTTVIALAMGTLGTFIACCIVVAYNVQYGVPHLGVLVVCVAYAADHGLRIFEKLCSRRSHEADPVAVLHPAPRA
jgi:hypothetical protein